MPNQVFIADSDLYNRCGGQAALTQLIDPGKTGRWNTAVSLMVRTDACNIVLSAAGVATDLGGVAAGDFAARFPDLVTLAAYKALALAWLAGSGGQAMPAGVQRYDEMADQGLELLATRRRKHGASDYATKPAQQINGSLDMDPLRTKMTMAGFRSGFC